MAATWRGSSGPGSITASSPAPLSTGYVFVPVRGIRPGFGGITCSDYRQLDLAGDDAHRHARHAPIRAWPAIAAAGRIPAPAVPGAGQLAAVQEAFTERTAIVRAVVVQGIQHPLDVGERVP